MRCNEPLYAFSFRKASSAMALLKALQTRRPPFFRPTLSARVKVTMQLQVVEAAAAARPRPRLPVSLEISRKSPVLAFVNEKFSIRLLVRGEGSVQPKLSRTAFCLNISLSEMRISHTLLM